MAEIRVERKGRNNTWLWIVLAVVLLIVAAIVLDRLGYVDLPIDVGMTDAATMPLPVWLAA
ncbi:MAG TPA: hypothetical protein VK928_03420 [Longimicrobiales bacterium]|nr:hypothetical protein [Longimicrobiales bacterium]